MKVDDFDFSLPETLIAQEPAPVRGESRLLVLASEGPIEHTTFSNLGRHLRRGDLLVVNDTRVFPARLLGHRVPTRGAVECLLLGQVQRRECGTPTASVQVWDALVHPGQKLKPGAEIVFAREGITISGEILAMHFQGRRTIRLSTGYSGGVSEAIERVGHVPLPPYIKRGDAVADRERYQTVYAAARGSVAAPTAGLHFTREQLADLEAAGVERIEVTLHVGYGTFKPVKATDVEEHVVDAERFHVSVEAAGALTRARREKRRIIAVGTTTVRTLESLTVDPSGEVLPSSAETELFIRPGHRFRLVDALITNFHLPRSSLLMLVSAFAGRERILAAYEEAIRQRYRFYSYGDAMLILCSEALPRLP